jgi:hypothetical protein
MYVQVNTSNGIENKDALERWAAEYLNDRLARFSQEVTAVEVQMTDENHGDKGGPDKRCLMEARLSGHAPLAVRHVAANQDLAFRGAAEKLGHALEHALGKLDRREHRDRESIRKDVPIAEEPASRE